MDVYSNRFQLKPFPQSNCRRAKCRFMMHCESMLNLFRNGCPKQRTTFLLLSSFQQCINIRTAHRYMLRSVWILVDIQSFLVCTIHPVLARNRDTTWHVSSSRPECKGNSYRCHTTVTDDCTAYRETVYVGAVKQATSMYVQKSSHVIGFILAGSILVASYITFPNEENTVSNW